MNESVYLHKPSNTYVTPMHYGIYFDREWVKFPSGRIEKVLSKDLKKTYVVVQNPPAKS